MPDPARFTLSYTRRDYFPKISPTKDPALPFKRYKRRFATILPLPLRRTKTKTQIVAELENIVRFRFRGL